ncbi:MAG: sulfite exporter TauE/SafE family protein [Acidimicrobiales bacterium]
MPGPLILLAGAVAGGVFGLFGAGGSAFATPMLALAGVPGALAVATPLPALLPASVLSARRQLRAGNLDTRIAGLVVAGGVPGAVLGALASSRLSGQALLVGSGILLLVIGARVLLPDPAGHADRTARWRDRPELVLAPAFAIGVLSGLLANSGGVLLVPMCILLLGLTAARAAGTSIVAAGALSIPTLIVHTTLGHVDWTVALVFGLGLLPGSLLGARVAERIPVGVARQLFGVALVAFAAWFLVRL